jgi:hypothetical protein
VSMDGKSSVTFIKYGASFCIPIEICCMLFIASVCGVCLV